jgi:hypothetical protein
MPVFKLERIDISDPIWEYSSFPGPVWTEAPDEGAARARVAIVSLTMLSDALGHAPIKHWPWIYRATCVIDHGHPPIAKGMVLSADGQPVDRVKDKCS